jgi:hypothetical protein
LVTFLRAEAAVEATWVAAAGTWVAEAAESAVAEAVGLVDTAAESAAEISAAEAVSIMEAVTMEEAITAIMAITADTTTITTIIIIMELPIM